MIIGDPVNTDPIKKIVRMLPIGIVLILALIFLVFPIWADNYLLRVLTSILMFAILSQSFGLITGFVGYPAFGNTAFFGFGAYTVAILVDNNLWYPLAILGAGVTSAILCMIVGAPILRLKGHYFAIATLGFVIAVREIFTNLKTITRGSMGWILPIVETDVTKSAITWYYWMFAILIICHFTIWRIQNSRFGYALRSIKAAETEAATFGVNTTRYKLFAWIISAFFTGLAGGVWALWITYIDPSFAFHYSFSIKFSIMAILGGVGTVFGPILGAIIVEGISQFAWGTFLEWNMAVLGFMVMIVILFFPGGLMELPQKWAKKNDWAHKRKYLFLRRRNEI